MNVRTLFGKLNRGNDVSVFISDEKVAIYQIANKLENAVFRSFDLEEGVVVNGYIKEPNILLKELKMVFKESKLRPYRVRFILHDQNYIVRDVKIDKMELKKEDVNEFVLNQLGKTLHIPYESVGIDTSIRYEDETKIDVLAVLTDLNLLHDYHDVFDRLGIKEVSYDIAAYGFIKIYEATKGYLPDVSMQVSFYDKLISIQIFEKEILVFNFVEEIDLHQVNFNQMIEAHVERVANFYQFNLKRNKTRVKEILFYNFNNDLAIERIKQIMSSISGYQTILFDLDQYQENVTLFPLVTQLPFYALQSGKYREKAIDFEVKRLKLIDFIANYVLIFALFVFGVISIVLIPYFTSETEIRNQNNYNEALELERDHLRDNRVVLPKPDSLVISYNEAYNQLNIESKSISSYLRLLYDKALSVQINNMQINQGKNEIVIYITGSALDLYEYVIDIYESYGDLDRDGFITSKPVERLVSDTLMEVKVVYA